MILKEVYDKNFITTLNKVILIFDKKFDQKNFLKIIDEKNWQDKSLKERMRTISIALHSCISPKDYCKKVEILKKVVVQYPKDKNSSLAFFIFPDFIEIFGLKDFDYSMSALEFFTEFGTAEFAVRQFIKLDCNRALKFFTKWTQSKNHHIRRLASEGCRPRLPWGEALPQFKKDPSVIFAILGKLKFDDSQYVRRSVANNLNDISKDNPEKLLNLLKKWHLQGVDEKLIKHALRTLLKRGDQQALALIGINKNITKNFTIQKFALQKAAIKMPESLIFDFSLDNQEENNKIRFEYALYFLNKKGDHFKKIFQITTKNFNKGVFHFNKKHSFKEMTTRKHNAGLHMISLVVNGNEFTKLQFELIKK